MKFLGTLLLIAVVTAEDIKQGACYNAAGEAIRCIPDFINIAFQAQVFASNTCGDPPSEFCVQQDIGLPNIDEGDCYSCDASSQELKHPTGYLTDRNEVDNQTWWQSNTLFDQNIENMTLHLPFNKSFDIEYIKIEFQGPRPESMVIEKSSDYGRTWEVYQYFSSSCYKTFNKRTDEQIYGWDETVAICTGKYSEISPLQGGVVAFSPLKDRPSAKQLERLYANPELLAWMMATDIRIRLIRLNTFGDQYFSNKRNKVLKTYYYAISDLSVGGRCTCYGHGDSCSQDACVCEHDTAGKNCERCLDMYNDLPWTQSTVEDPFVCQECECNGLASRCVFEEEVFEQSGQVSGGVCVGCRSNTAGQHCEQCAHGFYPNPSLEVGHPDRCLECQCNIYGSVGDGACTQQLDINRGLSFGDCQCKPHVLGVNCDTCEDGYHSLQEGCSRCDCDPVGTVGDVRLCDKTTGQCKCKDNISGMNCNECEVGFYGYLTGCKPCQCDLSGSRSVSCDQQTGQCPCRNGYQGKFCSEVQEGHHKPDMDDGTIQPDSGDGDGGDTSGDGDMDGEDSTGTATSTMGMDNLEKLDTKLANLDDEVIYRFRAKNDDLYSIVVKYFYPFTEDGPASVRFDVTSAEAPEDISQCTAHQVQSWNGTLVPKTSTYFYQLENACLDDGVEYTLRIALNEDIDNHIEFMGILLVPYPSDELQDQIDDLFPDTPEGQADRDLCYDIIYVTSRAEIQAKYPQCEALYDVIANLVTNGTISCDCDSQGSVEGDTCDSTGQCPCKEHVTGKKCDQCSIGFYDLGDHDDGCIDCECNEIGRRSDSCDNNGVCQCLRGVTGEKCDRCMLHKWNLSKKEGCKDCDCSADGSTSLSCDVLTGHCSCKPGVAGDKCERCAEGYYDFSATGCTKCNCNHIGGGRSVCDAVTGECQCKENVEGEECTTCKDNAFSLLQSNPEGCQACFCHGHTAVCEGDTAYTPSRVNSDFEQGDEDWKYQVVGAPDLHPVDHVFTQIRVEAAETEEICFIAPEKFRGNQLGSFLTNLKLKYNVIGSRSRVTHIVIRGAPYTLSVRPRDFNPGDRLSELLHPSGSWSYSDTGFEGSGQDTITSAIFQTVLAGVDGIDVCGMVYSGETIQVDEFSIGGVELKNNNRDRTAFNMEVCDCPTGYIGDSCEACGAGYHRADPALGPISPCVRCDCNGYSGDCDPDSGVCDECIHNTAGDNCEVCGEGYYGTPGYGNPGSCKQCQCPEVDRSFSNTCEMQNGRMVCTNCTEGHTGDRCDECDDGYFGEPSYDNPNQKCTPCTCNGNIDLEAEDNCNTLTGQCLKCVDNTAGRYCEECARGYYGDAIVDKDCTKCDCYGLGSNNQYLCDVESGQCDCKPNVVGGSCDRCKPGYYDIESGEGCEPCSCDLLGSTDIQCGEDGSCECREGYFGAKCNECPVNQYYHPSQGCTPCNCSPEGSDSMQCDESGQCHCKGTVQGKQCDTCPRNMVNIEEGCVNCPDCYSLVERGVDELKVKLEELKELMKDVDQPTIEASPDFKNQIEQVQAAVKDSFARANETALLADKLNGAKGAIQDLIETLQEEMEETSNIVDVVSSTVGSSERKLDQARDAIDDIERQLEEGVKLLLEEGEAALQKAESNMKTLSSENQEMQKRANQARRIAQEQEQKSTKTVQMAEEAEALAANALDTAKNARNALKETKNELDTLTEGIKELKQDYELAKNAATIYKQSAEETLDTAKQLKEQACDGAGSIDLEGLRAGLEYLEKKAQQAADNAVELQQKSSDMRDTADQTIDRAEALLSEGEDVDQGMSQLQTEAEGALRQSQQAVQDCAALITGAQNLLEVLQNYEKEVEKAKDKAEEAISELDSLEDRLEAAETKVGAAEAKLGDGQRDMGVVLESIKQARGDLEGSLTDAKSVADKIAGLLDSSRSTADESEELRGDVAEALVQIRALREKARNGTELLKAVLREADNSKATASSVASTVESGDRKLSSLQRQLDGIETLDAARLQELIGELTQAKDRLDEAGVDSKIEEMKVISDQQNDKLEEYMAQVQLMREEIATLEKIEAEIPEYPQCFNPRPNTG